MEDTPSMHWLALISYSLFPPPSMISKPRRFFAPALSAFEASALPE